MPPPSPLARKLVQNGVWVIFFLTTSLLSPAQTPDERVTNVPPTTIDLISERLSEGVGTTVDETAAWIDRRFGNLDPDDRERAHGYIRVVPLWVEHHGWETASRLRARVDLPNIDQRLHAVFGAGDSDNFISERPVLAELEQMQRAKDDFGDHSFLAGLGYSLSESRYSSFRLGGGIRIRFPMEPYVRARYIRLFPVNERTFVRFHETIYARSQRGEGSITGVDFEHMLTPKLLTRVAAFAHFSTWDERPQEHGIEASIARALSQNRIVALTGFGYFEPKEEVEVRDYGVRVVYRQRLSGDRLYGELHTGVTWPRYSVEEERRASLNLGIGLELHFGNRQQSTTRGP